MKNTIGRALLMIALTTSISAFASSEKAKAAGKKTPETTNCAAVDKATADSQDNSYQENEANEKKLRREQIQREEKEWLHNLENPSGG